MGLLQKLKSALGLNGSGSHRSGRESGDVDVTVEREPSTASEDAVKGTGSESGASDAEDEWFDDEDEEAETAGDVIDEAESDADETGASSASTPESGTDDGAQSLEDVVETEDDATATDEGADAAGDESEDGEADSAADDDETAAADDESRSDADEDAVEGSTDPVTEVSGIGPAYGERLEDAGVETVGELAVAEAEALSDATDVATGRVQNWIDAAREY